MQCPFTTATSSTAPTQSVQTSLPAPHTVPEVSQSLRLVYLHYSTSQNQDQQEEAVLAIAWPGRSHKGLWTQRLASALRLKWYLMFSLHF